MALVKLANAVACLYAWMCGVAGASGHSNSNSAGSNIQNSRDIFNEERAFPRNPPLFPGRATEQRSHMMVMPILGIFYSSLISINTPRGAVVLEFETLATTTEQVPQNEHVPHTYSPWHSSPSWLSPPCSTFGDADCIIKTQRTGFIQSSTCDYHTVRRTIIKDYMFPRLAMQLERLGYTNVPHHASRITSPSGDVIYDWKFNDCTEGFKISIQICYKSSFRSLVGPPIQYREPSFTQL